MGRRLADARVPLRRGRRRGHPAGRRALRLERAGQPRQRRRRSRSATWPTQIAEADRLRGPLRLGHQQAERPAAAPARRHARARAVRLRGAGRRSTTGLAAHRRWYYEEHQKGDRQQMKRALITGITGQDGSYLAELLLAKGYEVHGVVRRSSSFNTERLDHIYQDPHVADYRLRLHLRRPRRRQLAEPRRCARSSPTRSTTSARRATCASASTSPSTPRRRSALGTLRLLEAIRESGLDKPCASTRRRRARCSARAEPPQNETTPFQPRSPYACAKVFAHQLCQNYREAYGMFISLRHPLQPRVAAPRDPVRHAQDHARRGAHQARPRQEALPRQPRRQARLGLRRRLRRGDVADAPAGQARRLRDRHRRVALACASACDVAFGALGPRLEEVRRDRSALLPADRGRSPARRRRQGDARRSAGSRRSRSSS